MRSAGTGKRRGRQPGRSEYQARGDSLPGVPVSQTGGLREMQPRAILRSLCREEEFVGGACSDGWPSVEDVWVLVWLFLVLAHLDLSLAGLDRVFGGEAVMTWSRCLQYSGGRAVNWIQQ